MQSTKKAAKNSAKRRAAEQLAAESNNGVTISDDCFIMRGPVKENTFQERINEIILTINLFLFDLCYKSGREDYNKFVANGERFLNLKSNLSDMDKAVCGLLRCKYDDALKQLNVITNDSVRHDMVKKNQLLIARRAIACLSSVLSDTTDDPDVITKRETMLTFMRVRLKKYMTI